MSVKVTPQNRNVFASLTLPPDIEVKDGELIPSPTRDAETGNIWAVVRAVDDVSINGNPVVHPCKVGDLIYFPKSHAQPIYVTSGHAPDVLIHESSILAVVEGLYARVRNESKEDRAGYEAYMTQKKSAAAAPLLVPTDKKIVLN